MNEFKVGGKVTLGEDEKYIIVDIIEYNGEKYYFSSTTKKPIAPKIFQRIDEDGKTYINFIEDPEMIRIIANKVLEKNS